VTWEHFVASEASCRGACMGGADVDDAARRVSHRMATVCRPSSLGVAHDPTAFIDFTAMYGSITETPKSVRRGKVGWTRGAGAHARVTRRGDVGAPAVFSFHLACFEIA
jgi:hypothetical protein